jgi:hypothetical protein
MCIVPHVMPVGQSALVKHSTHWSVGTSQTPPPPPLPEQSPFVRHSTHRIVDVLQTGRPPNIVQSVLALQVATHVFVDVSQAWPVPQSESARQPTQVSREVSQTRPPPPMQSPLTRHWTHCIAAVLQTCWRPIVH